MTLELGPLMLATLAGSLLALANLAGLWLTLRWIGRVPSPGMLLLVSYLVRTAIVLFGFYLVMDGRWQRAVACLIGFAIARTSVLWTMRSTSNQTSMAEQ